MVLDAYKSVMANHSIGSNSILNLERFLYFPKTVLYAANLFIAFQFSFGLSPTGSASVPLQGAYWCMSHFLFLVRSHSCFLTHACAALPTLNMLNSFALASGIASLYALSHVKVQKVFQF